MAGFDDTLVTQWVMARKDKYNKTLSVPGGVMLGLDMVAQNVAPLPESQVLAAMKDFTNKPTVAIIDDAVAFATSRSVVGTFPALGTTQKKELNRYTYEAAFTVSPTLLAANAVSDVEYFNSQMEKAIAGLLYRMEADVITFVTANRTKVNSSTWPFAFNATTDTIEVTNPTGAKLEDEMKTLERSLTYAPSFLQNEGIGTPVALLASTNLRGNIKEAGYFGANNDRNLSGILEGAAPYYSSAIAIGSGTPAVTAKYFVLAQNSFGLYTWTSPEAVAGTTHGAASIGRQFIPGLGFYAEIFREGKFADQSAKTGGSKLTSTVAYRIMFDMVLVSSDVSDDATQPLPIVQVTVTAPPAA